MMGDEMESKLPSSAVAPRDAEGSDVEKTNIRLEKSLVRKLDMYIIPVYMLTYMFRYALLKRTMRVMKSRKSELIVCIASQFH
jgi:hypothetical protein